MGLCATVNRTHVEGHVTDVMDTDHFTQYSKGFWTCLGSLSATHFIIYWMFYANILVHICYCMLSMSFGFSDSKFLKNVFSLIFSVPFFCPLTIDTSFLLSGIKEQQCNQQLLLLLVFVEFMCVEVTSTRTEHRVQICYSRQQN